MRRGQPDTEAPVVLDDSSAPNTAAATVEDAGATSDDNAAAWDDAEMELQAG